MSGPGTNRAVWNGTPVQWVASLDEPYSSRWGDVGEDDEVEDAVFAICVSKGAKSILACWAKPSEWKAGPWKNADGVKIADPQSWQLRARGVK